MVNRTGKGESSDRFPLLGLQNHCGWWLQPWSQKIIAPWQESNDKPRQCVEKQSHYSADKDPYSQGYGFPVVTYGCEIWTIKKQNAKELMPWNCGSGEDSWKSLGLAGASRSNQSILRKINSEYSLEELMLKLMLQYFGHLMRTDDSVENSLMLGKIEGEEEHIRG